jgi:hypothetical protein
MIEKHYGRYIRSDSREQLERLFGARTVTFSVTSTTDRDAGQTQPMKKNMEKNWSGRVDLNHEERKKTDRLKPPRLISRHKKP